MNAISTRTLRIIGLAAALASTSDSFAADPAVELSRNLPSDANTIGVIRLARILETLRAEAEGWAEQAKQPGGSSVPTWVDTLVVGSLVRPATHDQIWSTAILRLPRTVTLNRIAQREAARVERLAGLRSVRAHRNAFMVEIGPQLLGIRSPAIRQEAARWARAAAEKKTGDLSDVLNRAAANPAHVILAIDLTDMSDSKGVRHYLEGSGLLPNDAVARVNLPQLLMTLRGISFFVTIDDSAKAQVVIDFDSDASKLGEPVAKVFRQLVADQQMTLEEFDTATVQARGKRVTLSMNLSDESLRRVFSLITAPAPSHRSNDETIAAVSLPADVEPATVDTELKASRRYFQAVSEAIDDLARVNRKANNYARTATWHENFARKIDHLHTAGVGRSLLAFGGRVSSRLRGLAASLRGQAVTVNSQQQTLVYDVNYDPGWAHVGYWGSVGYRAPTVKVKSNLQQVRERQAAAIEKGSRQRIAIWKSITDDRAKMEVELRESHGDDFFKK